MKTIIIEKNFSFFAKYINNSKTRGFSPLPGIPHFLKNILMLNYKNKKTSRIAVGVKQ